MTENIGLIKHLGNTEIGKKCYICESYHASDYLVSFTKNDRIKTANTICSCGTMFSIIIKKIKIEDWNYMNKSNYNYICQNKVNEKEKNIRIWCMCDLTKQNMIVFPFFELKPINYFSVCKECKSIFTMQIKDITRDLSSHNKSKQDYTLSGEGITLKERADRINKEFEKYIEGIR